MLFILNFIFLRAMIEVSSLGKCPTWNKPHCISNVYFHVSVYHNVLIILIFLVFLRYPMMMFFKGEKSPAYDTHSSNKSSFILKIIFTAYFFIY